ncbi:MAG: hypothetical protein GWN12_05700 [Thermoplasmata archaeon]|nr:hypothetical protein [Thermoplasmata archaeon]NIS11568.1 hypothetical protein [Thermoplasmata archaeon]NIW88279.1 hypothetical protein [Thermoplasmata archaeon]
MEELFRGYKVEPVNSVTLHAKLLSLLDDSLSHVELTRGSSRLSNGTSTPVPSSRSSARRLGASWR